MTDRRNRTTARATHGAGSRQQPNPYYVRLGHDLLDSPAWQALSPRGAKLLIAIWRRHNGKNNGAIPFSRDEACKVLGCHTRTAARTFDELQTKGFLRLVRERSYYDRSGMAREWEVTAEPVGETLPAEDFKRWKAED